MKAYQVWRAGALEAEDHGDTGPHTRFQASSVSKIVVAAAMLSLARDGVLALDDPVAKWWAPVPAEWADIRLAHLLSHTSGLGHWDHVPGYRLDDPLGPDELLERAARGPLLSPPGTAWRYSGPGFGLAAKVVESASGLGYGEVAASLVFKPLGMDSTSSGIVPAAARRAEPRRDGRPIALNEGFAALPGTGDLWTTVGDLTRLAGLRTSSSFEGVWQEMGRSRVDIDDRDGGHVSSRAYGFGLYLGTICGRPALFHHGDNPGHRSILAWLPDDDVTVAVLSNEDSTDVDALTGRLLLG